MAEGLDSLFNSPPGPSRPPAPRSPRSPSRTPSPSPSQHQRQRQPQARRSSEQPLFLSPGQTPQRPRPRPAQVSYEPEVDPFEEFENRYRSAAAGGEAGDEGVLTSALGAYDPLAPLGGGLGDDEDDDDETTRKKRKPIPKIDAERLMGPYGLPALMRDAKRFKVRGKGHEKTDLKALLQTYQIWAHRMFPKGDFMGTMTRVENNLRTRRMENAMKGYRDAFHPPPERSPSPPRTQDGLLTPPPAGPEEEEGDSPSGTPSRTDRTIHQSTGNGNGNGNRNGNGSRGGAGAGGGQREEPLFDDVDLDELAAMEEMEREQAAAEAGVSKRRAGSTDGSEPPVLQEEDEWEGLYD